MTTQPQPTDELAELLAICEELADDPNVRMTIDQQTRLKAAIVKAKGTPCAK